MSRLIDADALPVYRVKILHAFGIIEGNVIFPEDVKNAPTIDAEPVRHGRWIRMDDTFARWKCSECGLIEQHSGFAYCRCGAKMRCDNGTE